MTVSTITRTQGHPGYSETMPCAPESAATARSLVHTALGAWGMQRLADDSASVVAEFVANAARHTKGRRIRVSVLRPARNTVRVQVTDQSRTLPVPRRATRDDTGGRGLELVSALTVRWGTDRLPWGKRVWGELGELVEPGELGTSGEPGASRELGELGELGERGERGALVEPKGGATG